MKKNLCLLLTALLVIVFGETSRAQLIYTFAGTGTAGYSGDNGSSNAATFRQPFNIAVDTAGNIYITDFGNNVVRKVSTSGIITTVAGNGTAGYSGDGGSAVVAMMNGPTGIAVDIAGNIYIADQANNRVRKVGTNGVITTIAGNGTAGYTGDNGIDTVAEVNAPMGLAVDDSGEVFIADFGNNVVRKINTLGVISTIAGTGVAGYSGDGAAAVAAKLHSPSGVAIGSSGIYIADDSNNVIRMINGSGNISTFAGNDTAGFSGDGGPATSAKLNSPYSVVVDGSGNILIADHNNNRIRQVNGSGNISTIAGNGTAGYSGDGGSATAGELNQPSGLTVKGPNLYIADFANNVVRIVTSDIAPAFKNGPEQTALLCEDSVINVDTMLTIVDPVVGQTETWQIISGPAHGIVTGFPYSATSNGSTLVPVGLSYTPSSGYSGTDVLTFQVSDGTAVSITTISVTTNPTPNVIVPADQTVCKGSITLPAVFTGSVTGTTYRWSNSTPAIGLAASGTGNISAFTGANSTSAALTGTITVTPKAAGCPGIPEDFTITVNPAPNVGFVSNQAICNGASSAAINFSGTVSGTTYTWQNNNASIGLANSGTGNISSFTVTNSSTVTATATLTVVPTANGCTGTSRTFTISVRPTPTVAVPTDQTVCNGSATAAVNFTGTVSGTTYTWTNNNTSIGLASSGNGNIASFTATNTGTASVTATVAVTPTANTCAGTPQSFMITVNPSPDITPPPSGQMVCNGAASAPVNFNSLVSGTTYTWTNSNTSIGLANSGTGNIASFIATNSSTVTETGTVTVIPDANGCNGLAHTFTISVNPTPTMVSPANQTFCNDVVSSAINFSSSVSGITYAWSNNNSGIGLATSGTGNIAPFTPTDTTSVADTATITVTPSVNSCTGTPQSFMIIINPSPQITGILSDQVVCNGDATLAEDFSSSVSGTTFTWVNSDPGIGLGSSGTGNVPPFTAANSSNVVVTATITATPSANGCSGTHQSFTITINPTPDVILPVNQSVCNGAVTSAISFSSSVIGTTYAWSNNNNTIGLATSGNGNIAPFTAINTSSVTDNAMITVTPTANGCNGAPQSFFITVFPTPDVIPSPLTQSICNNQPTMPVNFSSSVSGAIYTWDNNNSSIGLAASGTGNIASFSAINTSNIAETATIMVIPSANGCNGNAQNVTITINPTPILVTPSNQVLCNNATSTTVNFNSSVAGTTYTWANNNTSIGLGATGNGNIAPFTATNTSFAIDTATITVTPIASGCDGLPANFTIAVNPTPDITSSLPDHVVCNGVATIPISFSSMVAGTTYSWSNSDPGIGLAATGTDSIASFTAINNSNVAVTAAITVTSSANGCAGDTQSFTITVDPTPVVTAPANQVLCNGQASADVNFISNVSGTTYTWTNNDTSIGLAATGSGNIASFIAADTGRTALTATITITPTANGCMGAIQNFMITVNPGPDLTITPASMAVCNGATTATEIFSSTDAGTTFSWANSNTGIGLAASGNGNIVPFTAVNGSNIPVIATITVTSSNGSCEGIPQSFMITVNPTPRMAVLSDQVLCDGAPTAAVNFTDSVSGTIFYWTNSNANIGLAASGNGNIPSFTTTNTTDTTISAIIAVTPVANSCSGAMQNFTISVKPTPNVATPINQFVCNGISTTAVVFSGSVAGTTYLWTNSGMYIGLASFGSGNIGAFTATNITNNAITDTITVTPFANSCPGMSQAFTITAKPIPLVNTPPNQAICNGTATAAIDFSGTINTAAYAWVNSNTNIGLATSGTGNIAPFIATDGSSASITATITVTPSANGCTGTAQSFMIMVNPTPVLNSMLTPPPVCDSTMFSYIPLSTINGTSFEWSRAAIAGISNPASSGSGNINEVLINATNIPIAAAYVYTLSASGCMDTQSIKVVVNPAPLLTSLPDPAPVCDSAVFSYLPSSNVAGAGYAWYRPYVTGIAEAAASGTGNPNEQLINTTDLNIAVTYVYTVTANNCSNAQNVLVTVRPTPHLSSSSGATVCTQTSFVYRPLSTTPATTFAWKRSYVAGITPDSASGIGTISEILVNHTPSPLNAAYVYTMNIGACPYTQDLVVTLNTDPIPVPLTTTSPSTVCANTLFQNFGTSTAPANGTSYSWSAVNATIATVGNNAQFSLVSFPAPGTAWVILTTSTSAGCSSNDSFAVNVSNNYADQPADVIYTNSNFIALQNDENGYQWGYDNAVTLDSSMIAGAINQNYYNSDPDFTNNLYWVMIQHNGCVQKSYYNNAIPTAPKPVVTAVNIFPNPATEKINVELRMAHTEDVKVEVLDIMGQKINETMTTDNKADIDVSGLSSGCYMLNCYQNGIKIAAARFIKN